MSRRSFLLPVLAIALLICGGFYPVQAQTENTHKAAPVNGSKPVVYAYSLERHQEIEDMVRMRQQGRYHGPSFVKNYNPETINVPNTILFTFSETDLSAGPAFVDSTRQTSTQPQLHVSRVSIVFAHEGWRTLHPLQKTPKVTMSSMDSDSPEPAPVFFIYYVLDRDVQESLIAEGKPLEYRFVVDGIWMADPANPLSTRKMNGALVSEMDLSTAPPLPVISPEIIMPSPTMPRKVLMERPEEASLAATASARQARTVILRWVGDSGQPVYVAGTFNQFDPYMSPMEAIGPDPHNSQKTVYELKLRLLAGQYYYHFAINGDNYLDPLNNKHGYGPEGRTYSQLQIP